MATFWQNTCNWSKAAWEGFTGYYKEKYAGTTGVWDAAKRTYGIFSEGATMIDHATVDKVKDPIKQWSASVAEYVDDGDNNHLSLAERAWSVAESAGDVADCVFSYKGAVCITAAGAGTAALVTAERGAALVLGQGLAVGGAINSSIGVYEIATAETKERARQGGIDAISGGLLAEYGSEIASGTSSVNVQSGVAVPSETEINPPIPPAKFMEPNTPAK